MSPSPTQPEAGDLLSWLPQATTRGESDICLKVYKCFVRMYIWALYDCSACGTQEKASGSLELVLQTVVSCPVGSRNRTQIL